MRLLLVLVMVAGLTACEQEQLSVSNLCFGSWVKVTDGRGHVRVNRLDYSALPAAISLEGAADGQQLALTATGFSQVDNRPLGSTTYTTYVGGGGTPTGPRQTTWQMTYLQTTDPRGGCQR